MKKKPDPVRWAVLAYIVADEVASTHESLDDAARKELEALLTAKNHDDVAIAAQIDYRDMAGVWRYKGTNKNVRNGCPETLRESNANDPEVFKEFLAWGREQCPADRYLLMCWGHGGGPGGFFSDADKDSKFPFGHPLTPRHLSSALRSFAAPPGPTGKSKPPFDILLMKACYACTLEVALQLHGVCDFLIASQNLIPSQTFWPYAALLNHLQGGDTKAVATQLVRDVGRFYTLDANRPDKTEVPYALIDLSVIERVVPPMKKLVSALETDRVWLMNEARKGACPGDAAMLDVMTFCQNLVGMGDKGLAAAAEELRNAVTDEQKPLVIERYPRLSAFRGINLFYHPGYRVESNVRDSVSFGAYQRSAFAEKTRWADVAFQDTVVSQVAYAVSAATDRKVRS
jgi:hypothetical protein